MHNKGQHFFIHYSSTYCLFLGFILFYFFFQKLGLSVYWRFIQGVPRHHPMSAGIGSSPHVTVKRMSGFRSWMDENFIGTGISTSRFRKKKQWCCGDSHKKFLHANSQSWHQCWYVSRRWMKRLSTYSKALYISLLKDISWGHCWRLFSSGILEENKHWTVA